MFSGIVEVASPIKSITEEGEVLRLAIEKPETFRDVSIGDSIANDGVCLTVDSFTEDRIEFVVGLETLRVTDWGSRLGQGAPINLERSLRVGDRIHGHLVTGHVDGVGKVTRADVVGQVMNLDIEIPDSLTKFVWPKGSLAVNGVSLTINNVDNRTISFHLIPETLRRTNLSKLKEGGAVNLEIDNMARGMVWRKEHE